MITIKVKKTKNLKEKVLGLIGAKQPYALMLKTRFGIHTFGLKFPIDVLILDKNNKVVKMKKSLKPNNIFLWNPLLDKVIELPQGTINRRKIKIKSGVRLSHEIS